MKKFIYELFVTIHAGEAWNQTDISHGQFTSLNEIRYYLADWDYKAAGFTEADLSVYRRYLNSGSNDSVKVKLEIGDE